MFNVSPYSDAESGTPAWKPGEREAAIAFLSLTIYLILDVNVGIYRVFKKKQGLYYWSLIFATWGTALVAVGNIFKNFKSEWEVIWPLWTLMINGGWSIYAPAELLVLYSRLHLVNQNDRLHRWLLIMIIVGSTLVIIPNWVFIFGAYDVDPKVSSLWSPRMAIIDRTSQACFTSMEFVISGVYIHSLLGILRTKIDVSTRRVMRDLIFVNITVVVMDLAVILLIFLNQAEVAYPLQDLTYAFKYKIEFVVLNQLMAIATKGSQAGRKKQATFEQRRYRRPSKNLVLTGYSDDNISGLRLPFLSGSQNTSRSTPTLNEKKQQWPLRNWTDDDASAMTNVAKPSPIFSKEHSNLSTVSSNNIALTDPNEKNSQSPHAQVIDFTPSPSLELHSPSDTSFTSQPNPMPFSITAQQSDDALLTPRADDAHDAYLPDVIPSPRPQQRQRNSLRQILFRRQSSKVPKARQGAERENPTSGPAGSKSNVERRRGDDNSTTLSIDGDSDDEGLHTWERRGRNGSIVPWFQREDSDEMRTENTGNEEKMK